MEEQKTGKDYIDSLESQLKKETNSIRQFGQVTSLKKKIQVLDENAENFYKKAKFAGSMRERVDDN